MKTRLTKYLSVLAMAVLLGGGMRDFCYGQEAPRESLATSDAQCRAIFEDVQDGISSGKTALLARHFALQVDVSLRGGESVGELPGLWSVAMAMGTPALRSAATGGSLVSRRK